MGYLTTLWEKTWRNLSKCKTARNINKPEFQRKASNGIQKHYVDRSVGEY